MKKIGAPKAFSVPSPGKMPISKPMSAKTGAPKVGKPKGPPAVAAPPAMPAVKAVGAVPKVPSAGIDALAVQPPVGMPAMKKPKKMGY